VAYSWGEKNIKKVTNYHKHNGASFKFCPWQNLAQRKKAKLKIIPIKKAFTLDMENLKNYFPKKQN